MSLTSTGYAYRGENGMITGRITTDALRGPHRLAYVRNQFLKIIGVANPTLLVLEDYAMGARGNNMFHIGELGGVLKTVAWDHGTALLPIPPAVLKKAITGKGNAGGKLSGKAKKQPMIDALQRTFGLPELQHDEADAAGLLIIGELLCDVRQMALTGAQLAYFDSIRQLQVIKGRLQSISFTN